MKVNDKSSIMFLNEQEIRKPTIAHPFVNAINDFNYLGIRITNRDKHLSSTNYEPMSANLSEEFVRRKTLLLSLIKKNKCN